MENFELGAEPVEDGKELTLEDIAQKNFVSLKEGEVVEITVKKLKKVRVAEGDKYKLSKTDYKFEILTMEDQVLNIIAWDLWGKIRKIMQDAKKINGIKLRIGHPSKGEYVVERVA
jgi:hypothetical protein